MVIDMAGPFKPTRIKYAEQPSNNDRRRRHRMQERSGENVVGRCMKNEWTVRYWGSIRARLHYRHVFGKVGRDIFRDWIL